MISTTIFNALLADRHHSLSLLVLPRKLLAIQLGFPNLMGPVSIF